MSGTDKTKVFYWDACVYLAWFLAEQQHGKQYLDALAQISDENFQRKNTIVTSTITLIEVLSIKIGTDKEALFRKSFRNQDHIAYDVDAAIAFKARELRERFLTGKKLATPDAIHIATALIYKADLFFTFDSGLLTLNKDSRVDGLEICKPFVSQTVLNLTSSKGA